MEPIFDDIQRKKADFILNHESSKLSELSSSDIKNLRVAWSYYSGKIEGNTYTYVETEALLTDGVTSTKKYEDAKMLKNLHNTFTTAVSEIRSNRPFEIDERTIKSLHSELTNELVENNERGDFRRKPVAITSTDYVPPKEEHQIKEEFARIIKEQKEYLNPLEKAVFLHCNLARLQPFIDGNKRTARMTESLVLMQNNIVPVYSTKDEDFVRYRDGLLKFYETKDYSKYADYFLDKQIDRINKVSLDSSSKYDLNTNEITKKKELTPEEQLSKAIYTSDIKKIEDLLNGGIKPNKGHLRLMEEMKHEKSGLDPKVESLVNDAIKEKKSNKLGL